MAADDSGEPSVVTEIVTDSQRLINIHVIENRLYHVYMKSLCVGGCVILSFDCSIMDSCICGNSIALILESGRLVIPSPRMLVEAGVNEVCETVVGLPSTRLFRRRVAATRNGKYVAVNISKRSIQVYRNNGPSLTLCRAINILKRGSFQIIGDDSPYVWHLYTNADSYRIDVFEANEVSSHRYPDEPIARCPIVPSERGSILKSLDDSKSFLVSCDIESLHGVLCYIDGTIFYLSLKSAVTGNLVAGLTRFPSVWRNYICKSRSAEEANIYICSQVDRKVFKLFPSSSGGEPTPLFSDPIGKIPFHMANVKKLHFAVTENGDEISSSEDLTESENGSVSDQNTEKTIICESSTSGSIKHFLIDARKSPRRILTIGDTNLRSMSLATPVKTMSAKLPSRNLLDVFYLPKLRALVLSTLGSSKVYLVNSQMAYALDFDNLISAGLVGNHTIAFVGPRGVALHSSIPPFKRIAFIEHCSESVILDAAFSEHHIIIRTFDEVTALDAEAHSSSCTILRGLTTTFVKTSGSHIFVGIDLESSRSRSEFKSYMGESQRIKAKYYSCNDDVCTGAIVLLRLDNHSHNFEEVHFHRFVPTGVHLSSAGEVSITVYGRDGTLGHLTSHMDAVEYTRIGGNLSVIGSIGDNIAVLGSEIFVVSAGGVHQLVNVSKGGKCKDITSAAVVNEQVIAFISSRDLKFLAGNLLGGKRTPTILNEMKLPVLPNSSHLRMLLIASQRVLILHGENLCSFYDSVTFDQILVTGITAAWCDSMALWRFKKDGALFEHLVFTDGKGWVESYSFRRMGPTLEFKCQYRAAIFDREIGQRTKELLYCGGEAIYVARGEYLISVNPGKKNTRKMKKLRYEARCISHSGSYLVVSTVKEVMVLESESLDVLAKVQVEDIFRSSQLDIEEEIEWERFEGEKEFVSHAASIIQQTGCRPTVCILCVVNVLGNMRSYLPFLRFDPQTKKIVLSSSGEQLIEGVTGVQLDPQIEPDQPQGQLKAYYTTFDHSIYSIEVKQPSSDSLTFKTYY